GRQRLEKRIAYLATIRPDGSPRVHPVSPFIAGGHLFVYMEPTSPKGKDLRRDARYSLHCSVEDDSGGAGEFFIAGRAHEITGSEERARAFEGAEAAGYRPEPRHVVFELSVDGALSTIYEDDEPKRVRWTSATARWPVP